MYSLRVLSNTVTSTLALGEEEDVLLDAADYHLEGVKEHAHTRAQDIRKHILTPQSQHSDTHSIRSLHTDIYS